MEEVQVARDGAEALLEAAMGEDDAVTGGKGAGPQDVARMQTAGGSGSGMKFMLALRTRARPPPEKTSFAITS